MDKLVPVKLNQRIVLGILIIFSILQALYNALLPIYLDEAYYWIWAMRPEFSYYDHPGMVFLFLLQILQYTWVMFLLHQIRRL